MNLSRYVGGCAEIIYIDRKGAVTQRRVPHSPRRGTACPSMVLCEAQPASVREGEHIGGAALRQAYRVVS